MLALEVGPAYYTPTPRHRAWYRVGEGLDDISLSEPKSTGMKKAVGFPRPIQAARKQGTSRPGFIPSISSLHLGGVA